MNVAASTSNHSVVIAIDGPSGSGKSSTSRGVAAALGFRYLDTGAMYRALTWWLLSSNVDVYDAKQVAVRASEPLIESGTDPSAPTIHVDGCDVAEAIRTDEVNAAVSPVSAVPEVRQRLLELQRAIIADADDRNAATGIVVEGRDIGSVVAPDADVKLYLTADAGARAQRRAAEAGGDVASTEKSLLTRDRIDSTRATAPLTMPDGAVHIDTTAYTLSEVIDRVVGLVRERAQPQPGRDVTPVLRPAATHPPRGLLRALRPVFGLGVKRYWDLHIHRRSAMPPGPVIAACNHTGWLDGPLLAIASPRPVHALTKQEMFSGPLGAFLHASGQIELDRFNADPAAIKSCLRVLADGGVAGIFPEGTRGAGEYESVHHGAAYLALVSGAPVVPVTMIGTRLPGGSIGSIPPRGSRIDVVFGDAWRTSQTPWPRTREHLLETSHSLWEHLREQQRAALQLTGRSLPGPLPAGEAEAEPDTGFGTPEQPTTIQDSA